ncbi:hypothetical protein [Roseicyclus sp.]|uniref:hypothetical protein n=1 Tax=Roseicyclus sp. TaxID=1914329 RepID=UPI003F6A81B4
MEPDFVCETHNPKHTHCDKAARGWFILQGMRAALSGCRHPRMTVEPMTGALLFEAWRDRPVTSPPPRFENRDRTAMSLDIPRRTPARAARQGAAG